MYPVPVSSLPVADVLVDAYSELPHYLTFRQGKEYFALAIERIKEVVEYGGLTEIPLMPSFLRGVMSLRGSIVPVVDLAQRLERPPIEITAHSCVIIVEVEYGDATHLLGLLVDAVEEVLNIPAGSIEAAPVFGNRMRANFISGIARVGEAVLIVLALDQVLSLEELGELVAHHAARGLPAGN